MYENQMDPAFAGMKADLIFDNVESFPVGAANLAFGIVTGTDANGLLVAGPGTKVRGLTLHSHAVRGGVVAGVPGYVATECASVLTRGKAWVKVTASGAVTLDGPVKFAADGTCADAGANTLTNAVFRSAKITTQYGFGDIALVELHNPFSEVTGA
jgi:hypothetical protein